MCSLGTARGVEVGSEILWVWFLVWKAGPSFREAVSMLTEVPVGETNLERQSAALFFAPEIHSEGDIVGGKFQTPPVYLVICILAIKE